MNKKRRKRKSVTSKTKKVLEKDLEDMSLWANRWKKQMESLKGKPPETIRDTFEFFTNVIALLVSLQIICDRPNLPLLIKERGEKLYQEISEYLPEEWKPKNMKDLTFMFKYTEYLGGICEIIAKLKELEKKDKNKGA